MGTNPLISKHFRTGLFSLTLLATLLSSNASAQVSVEVSPVYSAVHYANSRQLLPGDMEIVELRWTPNNDQYKATIQTRGGPLHLLAIDRRDIMANNPKPTALLDRFVLRRTFIDLPGLPSQQGVALVLLNDTQVAVHLNMNVFRIGKRSSAIVAKIREGLEVPIKSLDRVYVLPKFKVHVRPCASANAFSNPDIVICTELLAELTEKNVSEAVVPILLHEMAHSLLYLWGLPGYDNEDIADEFAAALLAKYIPSYVNAYIRWLESNDSVTEAVVQLVNGDRHTISIQRARNMKAALAKPDELLRRWSKLLAPFQRNP